MQFHPVAELFPLMSGDEFVSFCVDVRENGLREAIFVAKDPVDGVDKIADGRNRYNACIAEGVAPRYRYWDGIGDLTSVVVSLNLRRRHLTESQRAMVAAKLANMNRGRQASNTAIAVFVSQDTASNMLNVSPDSISRAAKVHKDGVPELVESVEAGEFSVNLAAQIAAMPKPQQKRMIKKGRRSAKRILAGLKTQSLRQTAKGYGTCLYCNPEAKFTDETVSAFAQRVEYRSKEALHNGRAERNFASYFENIAFEIEEEKRATGARIHYDQILAVIDAGAELDDLRRQCAEKTDIQRSTKIPWAEFNDAIATMLDLKIIEAVQQGGKTEVARGARKTLFRRVEKSEGDLTYEIDDDFPEEDVYLDNRWD